MSHPLGENEIEVALSDLSGWTLEEDQLVKTFAFASFREAIAFIVRLSFEAEEMNHHPELKNIYNRVQICLSTHDAGNAVTEKDVKLATKIEALIPVSPKPGIGESG